MLLIGVFYNFFGKTRTFSLKQEESIKELGHRRKNNCTEFLDFLVLSARGPEGGSVKSGKTDSSIKEYEDYREKYYFSWKREYYFF
jgi:hypothetical protein